MRSVLAERCSDVAENAWADSHPHSLRFGLQAPTIAQRHRYGDFWPPSEALIFGSQGRLDRVKQAIKVFRHVHNADIGAIGTGKADR